MGPMTPDRIFYPLAVLAALALIALAAVYPQGQGARSWGPFGHLTEQAPGPYAPGGALADTPAK